MVLDGGRDRSAPPRRTFDFGAPAVAGPSAPPSKTYGRDREPFVLVELEFDLCLRGGCRVVSQWILEMPVDRLMPISSGVPPST